MKKRQALSNYEYQIFKQLPRKFTVLDVMKVYRGRFMSNASLIATDFADFGFAEIVGYVKSNKVGKPAKIYKKKAGYRNLMVGVSKGRGYFIRRARYL